MQHDSDEVEKLYATADTVPNLRLSAARWRTEPAEKGDSRVVLAVTAWTLNTRNGKAGRSLERIGGGLVTVFLEERQVRQWGSKQPVYCIATDDADRFPPQVLWVIKDHFSKSRRTYAENLLLKRPEHDADVETRRPITQTSFRPTQPPKSTLLERALRLEHEARELRKEIERNGATGAAS